jgi:hypothetical protein
MSFSDQLENSLLDHFIGGGDYTRVSTVWVGLSTAAPLDDMSGLAEPAAATGYARVATVNSVNWWPAAASGLKRNAQDITFPEANSTFGTITHFALWNHVSSANATSTYLGWGALSASKAVAIGDTARFPTNSLSLSLD